MATTCWIPPSPLQVLDEVRKLMAQLDLAPLDVAPTAYLGDDLELDSLDQMDLLVHLEEHFDIDLRDEPLASVRTVQDVVDGVIAALEARPA